MCLPKILLTFWQKTIVKRAGLSNAFFDLENSIFNLKNLFMKQFITLFSIAGIIMLLASCKSNTALPIGAEATVSAAKAAEFAEFEAWKQQKDLAALRQQNLQSANENKTTVIYVPQKTRARVVRPAVVQSVPAVAQTESQPVAKKGWSKAAKGAVIGAGAGAVAGAIIAKKNRVLGAVIGGVAGGGVGYGIGRGMDKKDGRY
jgi:outer membrane lipoprotein SlyB